MKSILSLAESIRPPRKRNSRSGFTLLEVMVAMFVTVIGVLPIVGLLLSAHHIDQQAEIQAVAYNIGREQLETLRAQNYADLKPVTRRHLINSWW